MDDEKPICCASAFSLILCHEMSWCHNVTVVCKTSFSLGHFCARQMHVIQRLFLQIKINLAKTCCMKRTLTSKDKPCLRQHLGDTSTWVPLCNWINHDILSDDSKPRYMATLLLLHCVWLPQCLFHLFHNSTLPCDFRLNLASPLCFEFWTEDPVGLRNSFSF